MTQASVGIADQTDLFQDDAAQAAEIYFSVKGGRICRTIKYSDKVLRSHISTGGNDLALGRGGCIASNFDKAWLTSARRWPRGGEDFGVLNTVDLFSGCGGFTLGLHQAIQALGLTPNVQLAADIDKTSAQVYERNFSPRSFIREGVETVFDGEFGAKTTASEKRLKSNLDNIDLLIGGPPCQGHSDLNNHTRRQDPKNFLYPIMARAAEVLDPKVVIIENVPGARHDRTASVKNTYQHLIHLGYSVDADVIDAVDFGIAQFRKRYVMVASKCSEVSLLSDIEPYKTEPRALEWAIDDLLEAYSDSIFDSSAQHSDTNKKRIDYLFDKDVYELPDSQRPPCHRDKKHSYKSVYGRMYWDAPAQTITTGFGSTGQGRFVHPLRRRTLTPHEAARVQFFPDYFDFSGVGRVGLQQLIGNAVPSKLGYVLGMAYLPSLLADE